MTTHQKLKAEFPEIYIYTVWQHDPFYEWDGEGPDPQDEGYLPHSVTVCAEKILNGEKLIGFAYLGGCYKREDEENEDIDGYFEDLAREAITNLSQKYS